MAACATRCQCQDLAQFTCKSLRQTLLPVLGSGWRERERGCSHFSFGLFWTHDDRCSAVRRVLQHESTQAQMPVTAGDGEKSSHTFLPSQVTLLYAEQQWYNLGSKSGVSNLQVTCFCHEHHMLKTSQEPIQCESNWKLTPWYLFPCPQSECLGLTQYEGTFCQTSRKSSGCFWCRKLCYLSSVNCYVSIWTGCKFLNLGAEIFESRYKHHSHSPFLEWSELTFVTFLTDRVQCRSVFESPQHQHLPQAFTSSKIPDNIFFPVLRETSSKQIHLDTKELCHILWNKCHSSAWHCIKENFPELEDTIILSLLSALYL